MNKLRELFKNTREVEPSPQLEKAILSRIESIGSCRLRRKLALSYFGLAFSGLAAVYAFFTFGKNLLGSDFWTVLSLAFSDALVVAGHWREFFASLLETFPAIPAVAILAPIFIFLLSAGTYLESRGNNNLKYI